MTSSSTMRSPRSRRWCRSRPGDTAFTTNDCQPWQLTNAPLPPKAARRTYSVSSASSSDRSSGPAAQGAIPAPAPAEEPGADGALGAIGRSARTLTAWPTCTRTSPCSPPCWAPGRVRVLANTRPLSRSATPRRSSSTTSASRSSPTASAPQLPPTAARCTLRSGLSARRHPAAPNGCWPIRTALPRSRRALCARTALIEMELTATTIGLTASAKEVTALRRSIRVDGDELTYRLSMGAVGQPLQHHLAATLHRRRP